MTHALSAAEYGGPMRYADHGYTSDKQKKLPLNSEQECRDAWAWVNDPANAGEYSPAQMKRMKSRIKAAGLKYGLDLSELVMASADILGVELARPGTWHLKSGPQTVTTQMLDDAARFANREGARPGYLKLGHNDPRFQAGDGEPALGWLHNIHVEDDDGIVLKGDLKGIPDWLAAAIPTHWPDRSIEGWADYEHEGNKYGLVVDGLALLGVTPPGMSSIKSLRDLPAALGVAASASATRIVASFGEPTTPAQAEGPPKRTGAGMSADPVKIREALGLDPDASDDEVRTAFGTVLPPLEGAPVAASAGTVVLASSVWDETQNTIRKLSAFVDQTKRDERDAVIAKAVTAGKFTPAQKPHFAKLWDADPDGTRALINTLTPNSALAVMASGYAGEGVEADAEYAALYGNSAKVG